MPRRLTPRHRRTLLRRGSGGAAAGLYEHGDHRPATEMADGLPSTTRSGSIVVSGLVGRPGVVGPRALRSLAGSARIGDFDARSVMLADFFGAVSLDADAELVMWHGTDGSRLVTPIGRLLVDAAATLLLGGSDQAARPCWSEPVLLRSTSLPDPRGQEIVAATALTFAEFVGGVR